jgi:DNA polymerase
MLSCTACKLHETRTQVVPPSGDPNATIAIVGEAPGSDEDREGVPFIGRAGERLNQQLLAASIKREELFITNVLLCQPPNNDIRAVPDSIARCPELWLHQILRTLPNLRVVVAAGATSAGQWFKGDYKVGELVELARNTGEYVVIPIYHPSYCLRLGSFSNAFDTINIRNLNRAYAYSILGGNNVGL